MEQKRNINGEDVNSTSKSYQAMINGAKIKLGGKSSFGFKCGGFRKPISWVQIVEKCVNQKEWGGWEHNGAITHRLLARIPLCLRNSDDR